MTMGMLPLHLVPILYLLLLRVTFPVNAVGTPTTANKSVVGGTKKDNDNDNDNKNERIHIAIVSCGASRAPEALASMRSALLMTQHPLSFHIFHNADDGNEIFFTKALSSWQHQQQKQQQVVPQETAESAFDFFLYTSNLHDDYATLFAPCACQRLFLHESLPESVERVLYVDSDTLFLADVGIMWKEFETALQTHITDSTNHDKPMSNILAALVPEHQATSTAAYYLDQTNHPYYHDNQSIGLNSGVLLLNLRYLRAHPWNQELTDHLQKYTLQYYDQDLMNIYFHHHPDELLVLSCDWNFRTDHCFFVKQHCSTDAGIRILHGSRGTFHAPTTPLAKEYSVQTFQILHRAFSLFPATELGSAAAFRDAWLWLSSSQLKAGNIANHCDLLMPSIVTRVLTEAARKPPRLSDSEDEL
jgi:UDP-xylose:glucoside alpha-1,3-xylosyltransferase